MTAGLRLRTASWIGRVPDRVVELTPAGREYFGDLVEPFGATVDEDLLQRPGGHVSYTELVDRLVALLAERAPEPARGPDLALLAYALPDLSPAVSVAPYLNHLTGGRAIGFAVTEQGLGAPFTALRTALAFGRVGRCDHLVLAVVEQARVPTYDPVVHDRPLHGSGVLFAFDRSPGAGAVEEVARVAPDQDLGARLTGAARGADALAVVGPWVAEHELAGFVGEVHRVGNGHYCTSVWLALAEHGARWTDAYRRVLLCDRDPRSGEGYLAVLGPPATAA